MKFHAAWWGMVGALCLLTGCAGYRLGAPAPADLAGRSLHVAPAINETLEPRLTEFVTMALRRQVQKDGTFRLVTDPHEADLVLRVTVTALDRHSVSFRPTDIVRPQDFEVILDARAEVRDRTSGSVRLDRTFEGRRLMRIGPDLTSSERQTMPLVAEDLARQIILTLAEGEW